MADMAATIRSWKGNSLLHSYPRHYRLSHVLLVATFLFHVAFAVKPVPGGMMIPPYLSNRPSSSVQRVSSAPSILDVFQVSPPVLVPPGVSQCNQTLMVYSFANSYGKPFVGQYQPPPCDFNRVIMNFTVTSAGRQFDRLAVMYLDDTEIWRTSTAEPTNAGIIWTYMKDVSNYLSLWKRNQKVIFDLGNIVDKTYTGPFNTTLTATFFSVAEKNTTAADLILPLSAKRSAVNQSSSWNVPDARAADSITLPQNVRKAVFSLSACGQLEEEFWWSNALSSSTRTFGNNTLLGYSPFREIQLLIDGNLAGVAWPFPVIFTGGVNPGLWRPVVGIDAYDLQEDEIDITPWLSVLSDNKPHTFEIQIMGLSDDGKGNAVLTKAPSYWVVTGKIFLWLDPIGSLTTGSEMKKTLPPPTFFLTQSTTKTSNGTNSTLDYQVLAQRQIRFSATINTSQGAKEAIWTQTLNFSNVGHFTNLGNNQTNSQGTSGIDIGSDGYSRKFSYPLLAFSSVESDPATKAMGIDAKLDRGKRVEQVGESAFPNGLESFRNEGSFVGFLLNTRQNGTATYKSFPARNRSISWGGTEQDLVFSGLRAGKSVTPQIPMVDGSTQLYARYVLAVNGTVTRDGNTTVNGKVVDDPLPVDSQQRDSRHNFAPMSSDDVVGGRPLPGISLNF